MQFAQSCYHNGKWDVPLASRLNSKSTVCFVFFGPDMETQHAVSELSSALPDSIIIGCSGAGEIYGTALRDDSLIATIVKFEQATLKVCCEPIPSSELSFEAGKELVNRLECKGLKALYILSEGLNINGTELMKGIRSVVPKEVLISGGLAGDGISFKSTKVLFGNQIREKQAVALAFYGEGLIVGTHSRGGWLPFGPEREITSSNNNILYMLDGKPALTLYKEFLGKNADGLPASALHFPLLLGVKNTPFSRNTVRTVLAVDEKTQSMTFAGDMPTGETVRFMRSTEGTLVQAAANCATDCSNEVASGMPALSLMVSCVGRRIVLGTSTEDEIETVFKFLPSGSVQTGFYSYGEFAPGNSGFCDLHNQTITLTWVQEKKVA